MITPEREPTWSDGARAVSPILLGVVPFGLIFGVTAASADVPTLAAWASSFIVFAGASQIALVEVMDGGGAPRPDHVCRGHAGELGAAAVEAYLRLT